MERLDEEGETTETLPQSNTFNVVATVERIPMTYKSKPILTFQRDIYLQIQNTEKDFSEDKRTRKNYIFRKRMLTQIE
jgi:hypothetical protein